MYVGVVCVAIPPHCAAFHNPIALAATPLPCLNLQAGEADYQRRLELFKMWNNMVGMRSVVQLDAEGNPYSTSVRPLVPFSFTHNLWQMMQVRRLCQVRRHPT